jgi:hypothetical protein
LDTEKIIIQFAKVLSIIFHPLWMPLVIYITVRKVDPYYIAPIEADRFVFLLLGINILAPAISMLIMIRHGMLSSIDLRNRKERFGPYMLVIFYYILSYSILRWKGTFLPETVFSFFLSVICSLILSMAINTIWKISVHMLAQGGIFGTLIGMNTIHPNLDQVWPMLAIVMAGLTAYSRLKLQAHTHAQVYAGFCLGVLVNWIIISNKLYI